MGNKASASKPHVLDQEQLNEILGGSSNSTASHKTFRTNRSRSAYSTSSSTPTVQRKPSNILLAPPEARRTSKLAERWDCDKCGSSNEGHLMLLDRMTVLQMLFLFFEGIFIV